MRGKRTTAMAAAGMLAAHLIYAAAAGPASAMQILEAVDHAELAAEVSATGVNRIALVRDRIAKVVRSPDGFAVEHDAASGDLYLRPAVPAAFGDAAGRAMAHDPVTLFVGTEKGFTYRLTLTPADRDSAQILIRNADTGSAAMPAQAVAGGDPHVAALVGLIRAVARREPPAGYVIEPGTGRTAGGLPVVETWRGPRLAALVIEAGRSASRGADGAADLAGTIGPLPGAGRVAALWLAAPGTGPAGGRLAVIVTDAALSGDALPADPMAGGSR